MSRTVRVRVLYMAFVQRLVVAVPVLLVLSTLDGEPDRRARSALAQNPDGGAREG